MRNACPDQNKLVCPKRFRSSTQQWAYRSFLQRYTQTLQFSECRISTRRKNESYFIVALSIDRDDIPNYHNLHGDVNTHQRKDDVHVEHLRTDNCVQFGRISVVMCTKKVSSSGSDSLKTIS